MDADGKVKEVNLSQGTTDRSGNMSREGYIKFSGNMKTRIYEIIQRVNRSIDMTNKKEPTFGLNDIIWDGAVLKPTELKKHAEVFCDYIGGLSFKYTKDIIFKLKLLLNSIVQAEKSHDAYSGFLVLELNKLLNKSLKLLSSIFKNPDSNKNNVNLNEIIKNFENYDNKKLIDALNEMKISCIGEFWASWKNLLPPSLDTDAGKNSFYFGLGLILTGLYNRESPTKFICEDSGSSFSNITNPITYHCKYSEKESSIPAYIGMVVGALIILSTCFMYYNKIKAKQ